MGSTVLQNKNSNVYRVRREGKSFLLESRRKKICSPPKRSCSKINHSSQRHCSLIGRSEIVDIENMDPKVRMVRRRRKMQRGPLSMRAKINIPW